MPQRSVLFYISGHGYGHARRCAGVIAALRRAAPEIDVRVRTRAPARIFAGVLPEDRIAESDVDAGAAERSTLEIDAAGTLARIAEVLDRKAQIIAVELPIVRAMKPALIVADIPFLAGDIAAAAGVPCVGLSNFTWDWIAEPLAAEAPARPGLLQEVSDCYAKMSLLLRLPLGGVSDVFPQVIDMPLVANVSQRDPAEVLRHLRIDPTDRRPRALFSLRGAIPSEALAAAVRDAADFLLLCPTNEPGSVPEGSIPVPLRDPQRGDLDFSDVLRICEVAVGKLGYGLVAECIASGVALLWPRRTGFREDAVVEREGPQFLRMREMPREDFHAGRWGGHLRAAVALPPPPKRMPTDGAEQCAAKIAELADAQ